MATVAEYSAPYDFYLSALVGVFVVCYELLTVEVFSTTDSAVVACEVFEGYILQCHRRSGYIVAVAECYGEWFSTCYEVHCVRTSEVESIAHLHIASSQYAVAQCVHTVSFFSACSTYVVLLFWINPSIGVGFALTLYRESSEVYSDSVVHIVDRYDYELASRSIHAYSALVQRTLVGQLVTIVVSLATDSHCSAFGYVNSVSAYHVNYFCEDPAATSIGRTAILP